MKNVFKVLAIIALTAVIGFSFAACDNGGGGGSGGGENNNVGNKTLIGIVITTQPAKTTYAIGDTLDLGGLVVTATYSDNTTQAVTGYTTSGFDSSTAGTKTVTVIYGGKTAAFMVVINAGSGGGDKTVLAILITSQPAKLIYTVGDTLDTSGLVVTAYYSDSTTQAVTGYTTSGFDSSTTGTKTVTVSYGGKTTSFIVVVNAGSGGEKTVRSIRISSQPTKQTYAIGDTLDRSGLVVTATYSDYTTQAVTDYTTSGFDSSTAGEKTVTVSYGGQTATFKVQVYASNAGTFNSISAFEAWLKDQPINSANTAHTVKLNVSSLDGDSSKPGSVGNIIRTSTGKYLSLDLSGSTITSIGVEAFYSCTRLTGITIPNSVTSIGKDAFSNCNILPGITIPNSVTSIGVEAFRSCTSLTSITIPNSVTSIGNFAFDGCRNLANVTIPNSVTSIGEGAFYGCRNLTSVTIPNSITIIENNVFSSCSGLTSVTIPNSVTSIGEGAFSGCRNLPPSVTFIPNSVTRIGSYAFSGCSSFTSVTIPAGVTSIGSSAFDSKNITSVTFQGVISSSGFSTSAFYDLGNLRDKYFETNGGIGTYTRTPGGSAWAKQ